MRSRALLAAAAPPAAVLIASLLAGSFRSAPASSAPAGTPPLATPIAAVDERGEDGVTFVIQVPDLARVPATVEGEAFEQIGAAGFGATSEPGLPSVPFRTFTIAVPPGREPVPRVTVLESESLDFVPAPAPEPTMDVIDEGRIGEDKLAVPGFRDAIDRAFYGGAGTYPELLFEAGPLSWLRQQQVFDLTVYPVRYDARARRLTVARRLEVRVDFRAPAGAAGIPARLPARDHETGFESIYRNTIVNYESARRFRAGPRAEGALLGPGGGPRTEPAIRLELTQTGPVRLTYAELEAAGLPAGLPVARLRVDEWRYVDGPPPADNFARDPLPIEVTDVNQVGTFDAGDAITFFGRSYKDRVGPTPYLLRYTEKNVAWLGWEEGTGARLATRPGWLADPVVVAAASFPDTFHFEEDAVYFNYGPRTPTSPSYASHEAVVTWYLTRHFSDPQFGDPYCADPECRSFKFPISVPDVDTGQPARARAQMVSGVDQVEHLATFLLLSGSREDTLATQWGFSGHQAIGTWEGDPFPSSLLTRPNSFFKLVGQRRLLNGEIGSHLGAHFDWFEFAYARLYRARGDRLLLSSGGASGPTEFRIANFTRPNIAVYDVTDPLAPVLLTGVQVTGGGPYEVRFRDDVASPRRYAAFARASGEIVLAAGGVSNAPPVDLATGEADYVIVVPDRRDVDGDGAIDDFEAEARRLADHRQAQGLRVRIARLSDLYNEFDGGLARPLAIRNYLRYAFSHWTAPPLYLLLAGDGSEDYRDKRPKGLNVVPTQIIFGPVYGDLDLELVSSDSWFVAGLGEGDGEFDLHHDMAVGRLPAQSAADLRSMIDKTIAYERFDPADRWRARTLTISDDAWSSTISFNAEYRFRSSEVVFDRISDSLNTMVRVRSGFGDLIETRSLKLSTYSDQLPPGGRTAAQVTAHFDTTGSPLLYQLISDGNLLMSYQGHANRFLLAHERMFFSEIDRDHEKFNNLGRPSIWFLYACHPNHFYEWNERVGNVVSGRERALGELLVARPSSGLVASVASTGFEWLPGYVPGGHFLYDLNTPQWEAFFLTPPETDPAGRTTGPRWILGEVVNLAKEIYTQLDGFDGLAFTYCILGDPALRVDAIPPAFQVSAADSARAPGARIESFSAKSDTVLVTAEIRDEARIDLAAVEVSERRATGGVIPVPRELWTAEAPDNPDTNATWGRRVRLTYRAPLRPDDYDIVLAARDPNGRSIEFPLRVRVDLSFLADGSPISDGDFVSSQAAIAVDLHAPVALAESSIRLLLDGNPIGLDLEPRDALGKDWRLKAGIDTGVGEHVLRLEITHRGAPALARELGLQVGADLGLRQVAAYPNPFDRFTAITYQLTSPADEVAIRIFTISGRLIREIRAPRRVGYSQVAWDGLDEDGNQVANGVYIYRVEARGPADDDQITGRLVRARR